MLAPRITTFSIIIIFCSMFCAAAACSLSKLQIKCQVAQTNHIIKNVLSQVCKSMLHIRVQRYDEPARGVHIVRETLSLLKHIKNIVKKKTKTETRCRELCL